jgi:dihydrofolate reductase
VSKIVSNFFMSLDGVVEAPGRWQGGYFNAEMGAAMGEALGSMSAFVMGRVLHDEWSGYWPQQADRDPFAAFINNVDKYVVSNTLETTSWGNTTIISGDSGEVAARLREVRERATGNVGLSGSGTLVRWLLEQDLLDELRLQVHPVVVGEGRRLFEGAALRSLELVQHQAFSNGVLNLLYRPKAR